MKLLWHIEEVDIQKVKSFYNSKKDSVFVINRIHRNIDKNLPVFSKELFWEAMISCLITTQQRSGPRSYVTKFISTKPFPLNYPKFRNCNNIHTLVEEIITQFGGLRRGKTIGYEVESNFDWLEKGGWKVINMIVSDLDTNHSSEKERQSAEIIIDNLIGFGPKQSRNLLQSLGLTKYEIPVDSRITKWLNAFGFPLKLSATALSDRNYYNEWSKDNLVW
jgi:hypothetical protein